MGMNRIGMNRIGLKQIEIWIELLTAADRVAHSFIHDGDDWIDKFKAEYTESFEALRAAIAKATEMIQSHDGGLDYTNCWHVGVTERQRCILEDYVQELSELSHKFHLRLLAEDMDAMESALRLDGVNKSDP